MACGSDPRTREPALSVQPAHPRRATCPACGHAGIGRASARIEIGQYVEEKWNRARLAARIDKAVAWRQSHGGRARLWCAEFGCYQANAKSADRLHYLCDMRSVLEERGIGWAYWSYNETFTIMTAGSKPFWQPTAQTPDRSVLDALMPERASER